MVARGSRFVFQVASGTGINQGVTACCDHNRVKDVGTIQLFKIGLDDFHYLPVALTIAGTDPSGGAGIMADLKSFQARDVYGMAVVTSLVAQNTRGVQLIEHVSPQMLKAQLESVFSDIKPQAVKTGMLATTEIMEIIQPYLKKAGLSLRS